MAVNINVVKNDSDDVRKYKDLLNYDTKGTHIPQEPHLFGYRFLFASPIYPFPLRIIISR